MYTKETAVDSVLLSAPFLRCSTQLHSIPSSLLLSEDANGGDMQHSSFQSSQIHPEAQGK